MEIKVTSARALKRAFKILISGVSGSGKTYSSLQMAKAFGSKKFFLSIAKIQLVYTVI